MFIEIVIFITTAIVVLLLFIWLVQVFKSTVKTVLIIGVILILLQVGLGVSSDQIIQNVAQIVESIRVFVLNNLSSS